MHHIITTQADSLSHLAALLYSYQQIYTRFSKHIICISIWMYLIHIRVLFFFVTQWCMDLRLLVFCIMWCFKGLPFRVFCFVLFEISAKTWNNHKRSHSFIFYVNRQRYTEQRVVLPSQRSTFNRKILCYGRCSCQKQFHPAFQVSLYT